MAPRKIIDTEEVDETLPAAPSVLEQTAQDDLEKIAEFFASNDASGAMVRVWRKNDLGAEAYAGQVALETFGTSWEWLRDYHGSGRYKIRLVDKRGKFVRQAEVEIDKGVIGKLHAPPPAPAPAPGVPSAPVPADGGLSPTALLIMMLDMSQKNSATTMAMMMEMAKVFRGGPATPQDGMAKILESMGTSMTAMQSFAFETMKRVGGPGGNLTEQIEQVKALKSLVEPGEGGEEKEDAITKLLGIMAPVAGAMFARAGQAAPPPPRRPIPAPPAPAPNVVRMPAPPAPTEVQVEQAPPAETPDMTLSLLFKNIVVPMLLKAARNGTDTVSYADFLVDQLDPAQVKLVYDRLKGEDWQATLFDNHPKVAENKAWFDALRREFLRAVDDLTDPDDSTKDDSGPPAV